MRLSLIAAALASAIVLCEGSTKMVIGYFPNWLYANYPIETIPFNKYTHINYAFAILNNEDNLPSFTDDWAVESSLPKLVDMAHANKSKVLLSVGGWTGSKRFSPMVATAESRKKFIDWNLNFIAKYKTDGVDLDWEYPGKQAAGCNEFADNDADNFLLLLKELRQALDTKYPEDRKEISMAVHVQPFIKSGVPMTDVKAFVPYFDHINLMTYDMNGAWAPTTGPNAPFQIEEGKGAPFSFVESIRDWKAAGVPGNKITAGLAFYGRTMKAQVDMTAQRNQFQSSEVGAPKGDSDDAYWDDPYCNVDTGGFSGIWKWTNLRKEGLLKSDYITPGEGWERNWDNVTQTPWLFNPSTKHFITYDDPQSLNIKVEHALCEDLAGVMVWDIHQDNGELVDIVNKIHNPAPATCENTITTKSNQVTDAKPLVEVEKEGLDDLGDLVDTANNSVEVKQVAEETSEPEDSDFDDSEWEGEEEDWSEEDTSKDETTSPSTATSEASSLSEAPAVSTPSESSAAVTEASSQLNIPDAFSEASSEASFELEKSASFPEPETPTSASPRETPQAEDFDGGSCSTNGLQKCSHIGESPIWLTCNFDKWISRECSAGLVCNENQGNVFCDFPPSAKVDVAQDDKALVAASINDDVVKEAAFGDVDIFPNLGVPFIDLPSNPLSPDQPQFPDLFKSNPFDFGFPAPTQSNAFGLPTPSGLFGSGFPFPTESNGFDFPFPPPSNVFGLPFPTESSGFGLPFPTESNGFGLPTPSGLFGSGLPFPTESKPFDFEFPAPSDVEAFFSGLMTHSESNSQEPSSSASHESRPYPPPPAQKSTSTASESTSSSEFSTVMPLGAKSSSSHSLHSSVSSTSAPSGPRPSDFKLPPFESQSSVSSTSAPSGPRPSDFKLPPFESQSSVSSTSAPTGPRPSEFKLPPFESQSSETSTSVSSESRPSEFRLPPFESNSIEFSAPAPSALSLSEFPQASVSDELNVPSELDLFPPPFETKPYEALPSEPVVGNHFFP